MLGRGTPRRLVGAAALLGLLVCAVPARADEAAMSRFHYEQATRDYEQGRYERAVQQFFLAQRLSPNPRTLYNIGLCFRQMGRHADAFHFLSEYLEQDDDAKGAEDRREFASTAIDTLEPRVARVRVSSDPPGATVFVDHREHGAWGAAPRVLALPPGRHTIWVELEGYRRAETTVEAVVGDKVEVTLEPERILGTLHVAAPEGAEVRALAADGRVVAKSTGPLEARVPPGRYEVHVAAEAYRPHRDLARVDADQRTDLTPELERRPPPTGALAVTANVREAVVEIDGEPAGFTPLTLSDLPTRPHRVAIEAPEHVPWSGEVEVEPNEQAWVRVHLAEEPSGRSPATWAFGGVGAALLVGGAITGGFALARHDEFEAEVGTFDAGNLRDDRRRGRVLAGTTDVLLGLGGASLVTAIVLYFVTDDSGEHESEADISGVAR